MKISRRGRFWWLFRRALVTVYEDNGLAISKGAAYSALLAFFPVLTTVATLLVQAKAERVARVISEFLFEVVPPGTEELVMRQFTVRGERPVSLLVGAVLISLWAASGLMMSLMEGFDAVYRVPASRPFLRRRGVSILLVFSAAIPALGASALVLFGARTELALARYLGVIAMEEQLGGWLLLFGKLTRYAVALGTVAVVATLMYKFGPNRPQRWRDVWPGACIAAFLWLMCTLAFGWYVGNIADYNVLYGSIGAVIALIIWMYLLVVSSLVGCAFNAESEQLEAAANSLSE